MKKMCWPKNGTSKAQNGLSFNIYHYIEPNFEKEISFKLYHQGARISIGHFPSPLMVEFETNFFPPNLVQVMIYVEVQAIFRFESTIFRLIDFFHNWSLHMEVQ